MTVHEDVAAEAWRLRRWAEAAGVFGQGRSATPGPAPDPMRADAMFGAGAARAFVGKPITAVGFAASEREGPRLFVYTRRRLTKAEEAALSSNDLSVPVVFRVAQPFGVTGPSEAASFPTMFRKGRLTCGSSISIGNSREAGTLGTILRDGNGELFGLSCNHVSGGCSNARVTAPIVSPGILDVGPGAPDVRTVGHHHRSLPFLQGDPSVVQRIADNTDAAVFKLLHPDGHTSWQGEAYDTPSVVEAPREDDPVEKVGRTTHHTRGIIESQLVGSYRIDYQATVYHSAEESIAFRGTVSFEPLFLIRGVAGTFATDGDSGALVVRREPGDAAPRSAVGIVIGGRGTQETYMLPLEPILDALGMSLVSGHG